MRLLDHVGIAVHSIDDAAAILGPLVGDALHDRDRVESQGVEVGFLGSGFGRVELLAPLHPESPVARHLERRGPGLHHLCYRVVDLQAALERARSDGFRLVDEAPRSGAHGHRVAFLHPKSTAGVLIELLESPSDVPDA